MKQIESIVAYNVTDNEEKPLNYERLHIFFRAEKSTYTIFGRV